MAGDNDIGFKIYAKIDGLKEQMGQAGKSIKDFSEGANSSIGTLGGAFKGLSGVIGSFIVLAVGAILRESIQFTTEWTTEVRNLARNFGITTEEASGLALALDSIQVTTDDYRGAASKLGRQIKSNEEQVNALGVATRDQNGNLLSQQQLMLNAIGSLKEYKEGTDRNIASQFLFGRGAGELANLLRLTKEELQEGTEDAKKFGLVVGEVSVAQMQEYKKATNDVGDAINGFKLQIGNALIPMLTYLAKVFTDDVVPVMQAFGLGLKAIGEGWEVIGQRISYAIEKTKEYFSIENPNASSERPNTVDTPTIGSGAAMDFLYGKPKTVPKGFGKEPKDEGKEAQQLAQQNATTQMQLDKMVFDNKRAMLAEDLSAGFITKQQQLTSLRDLANQEYALDQRTLLNYKQSKGMTVAETNKANNQLKLLKLKHENELQQLNRQSVAAQMAEYRKLFSAFRSSFSGAIQGILQGTQTWQQAMNNVFSNLLSSFVGFLADMLMNWIETQIMMAIFGEAIAGSGDRATIAGHAATAGAGAYAATAVIPVIGPAIAPAAAAAAYAGAMTYQLLVPAAKMGFDIPKGVNPLTQLHEEEMVLPAPLANAVRDMAGGGGSGSSVTINLSAIDTRSGAEFLKQNASAIAQAVKAQMRNANPALAGMKG